MQYLTPSWTRQGHVQWVNSVAFSNSGRWILSGSADRNLRIWDVENGTLLGMIDGHRTILSVAISPDDRRIASGGTDGTIVIWNIALEERMRFPPLVKHSDWVNSVCFSPNGRTLASGSRDATVIIWDVETGDILRELDGHCGSVLSVAFSPDGLRLASASWGGTTHVWRTDITDSLPLNVSAHQYSIRSIVWSPDGQQLVSASFDMSVKFWNSSDGHQIGQSGTRHSNWIRSLATPRDGSYVVTASDDKTVRLWCTETHQQIGRALVHTSSVNSVAASPDGALLASGDRNGQVYLWSIHHMLERHGLKIERKCCVVSDPTNSNNTQISHDIHNVSSLSCESMISTLCDAHARTSNPSADDTLFDAPSSPPRAKLGQDQVEDENKDSGMDVDILDGLVVQRSSLQWQQGTRTSPGAQSLEYTKASQNLDTNPIPDCHSPIHPIEILQDLTDYITKDGKYPVASGGFGEVWKCTFQTDQEQTKVAVKSLRIYMSDEEGEAKKKKQRRINRELRACALLKHENILRVLGYTRDFGMFLAIVSRWAENGDLTTYLERENETLTPVRRFQILRDIAAGLKYMHANDAIHGDLTGPNVLIYGDGTACLSDFGLSLLYSEVEGNAPSWTSTLQGNIRWLAPERVDTGSNLSVRPSKCGDIYSFGCIMLHALTSKIPYYYIQPQPAIIKCMYTKEKPSRLRYPGLCDQYWNFIEECWSDEPSDRPSAERVAEVIGNELGLLSSSNIDP